MTVLALTGCPQEPTLSSDATVASVTVAGKTVTLGTPSSDWTVAKSRESVGRVYLTQPQMSSAEVVVGKGQDGQTVYLARTNSYETPNFVTDSTFTFTALDYLWVEIFSENHDDYKIYAIEVRLSGAPSVTNLFLGDRAAKADMRPNGQPIKQYGTGLGTPNADLSQVTEGEIWFGNDQAGQSLAVAAEVEDPDTTVLIATGAAGASADTLFPAGYTSPENIEAVNGNYVYIKAVSADTQSPQISYYKLKLVSKKTGLAISGITISGTGGTPVFFNPGTMGTNGFGGGENHSNGAGYVPAVPNGDPAHTDFDYKNIGGTSSATNVTVAIANKPEGATFRYGHTDFFNAQEDVSNVSQSIILHYQDSATLSNVSTNEYIAVEVTNELGDKGWYAFRVRIGNNDDISALSVDGNTITLANAKNENNQVGEKYQLVRYTAPPTDSTSDGNWDSSTINWTGGSQAQIQIAFVSPTDAVDPVIAAIDNANWINASSTSYTATNQFGTGTVIVFRVKNMDGYDYFYKVQVAYGSSTASMTALSINNTTATVGKPGVLGYLSYGWSWNAPPNGDAPELGRCVISGDDPATVSFNATLPNNATARYGWSGTSFFSSVTTPTTWVNDNLETGGNVQQRLMIEVVSQDKTVKRYYIIPISKPVSQ
jgi:hypothetical protein